MFFKQNIHSLVFEEKKQNIHLIKRLIVFIPLFEGYYFYKVKLMSLQ